MLTEEFKRKAMNKLEETDAESMVKTLESIGSVRVTKGQQWITKAVQLLKQMESCGTNIDYGNWREPYVDEHVCPICGCSRYHSDSCELQELLKEAEGSK